MTFTFGRASLPKIFGQLSSSLSIQHHHEQAVSLGLDAITHPGTGDKMDSVVIGQRFSRLALSKNFEKDEARGLGSQSQGGGVRRSKGKAERPEMSQRLCVN